MQILNQLYAGKKITLSFPNEEQREQFRQKIYKLKKTQDAAVSAVLNEEKQVLKTKKFQLEDDPNFHLQLWTADKKAPTYIILSVEEGEQDSNGLDAGRNSTGSQKS